MTSDCYRFGRYLYDCRRHRLCLDGEDVQAHSRTLFVLRLLLDRPGQTVDRDEIVGLAWPNGAATHANLMVQVSRLRAILAAAPDSGQIVTERGTGYRFEGEVVRIGGDAEMTEPDLDEATRQLVHEGIVALGQAEPDSLRHALICFDRCIERYPRSARLRCHRVLTLIQGWYFGLLPGREVAERGRNDVEVAMRSAPSSAKAQVARAALAFALHRDFATCDEALTIALSQSPEDPAAHEFLAYSLFARDRMDEGRAHLLHALRINPGHILMAGALAISYYFERRYGEAVELCEAAVEMAPGYAWTHIQRVMCTTRARRFDLARESVRALEAIAPQAPIVVGLRGYLDAHLQDRASALAALAELESLAHAPPFLVALIHSALGNVSACLDALRSSLADPFPPMIYLAVDPCWDDVREHPTFAQLIEAAGLAGIR